MLILGKKMTRVKLSGAFDGIIEKNLQVRTIALWEICRKTHFPGLPTGKMVTDLPWLQKMNDWNEVKNIL